MLTDHICSMPVIICYVFLIRARFVFTILTYPHPPFLKVYVLRTFVRLSVWLLPCSSISENYIMDSKVIFDVQKPVIQLKYEICSITVVDAIATA